MSEKIWFLKHCDLFARLKPGEARHLEGQAVMRAFQPRAIIYLPTEMAHSVMVLARGRVKIKALAPDGKETILAFIEEGEIFGELALLDTSPRNEYAEAVTEALILAIPREALLWLMAQRPDIALSITKLVGFRRRRIENRLRNILFRSTRERVVGLLLELLESHGKQVGKRWEIRLPLSHQELASLIGATRETVTLTLSQLQLERLIQVRRRQLTVLDRDRLVSEATGTAGLVSDNLDPEERPRAKAR